MDDVIMYTAIASRAYVCSLCGRTIESGKRFWICKGMSEGNIFNDNYHMDCHKVIQLYLDDVNDVFFSEEEIGYWWRDERCQKCKKYYVDECNNDCDWFGEHLPYECDDCNESHKCMGGDTCDIMDRGSWCTQYEVFEE